MGQDRAAAERAVKCGSRGLWAAEFPGWLQGRVADFKEASVRHFCIAGAIAAPPFATRPQQPYRRLLEAPEFEALRQRGRRERCT